MTLRFQDRLASSRGFGDFVTMHEAARHAIHSSEILSVSVETVTAMQQQSANMSKMNKKSAKKDAEAPYQVQAHIDCQARMLRSLFLRSQSNKERLQNEIALVMLNFCARDISSADPSPGVQHGSSARQQGHDRPWGGSQT